MDILYKRLTILLMFLVGFVFVEGGLVTNYSEARSMKGGRIFKMTPYKKSPTKSTRPSTSQQQKSGGFKRSLAGGLLGGAMGAFLFGSLFGAGGSGMGILPILILGVGAYFLFRKMSSRPAQPPGYQSQPGSDQYRSYDQGANFNTDVQSQTPPVTKEGFVQHGIDQIQLGDPSFDPDYFKEVASDVFFQVQAGWMRRDISSYRHLLGEELAKLYEEQFTQMRQKGQINKLESIAVRNVEIIEAGSDGREDFVTLLFAANLLDYTVDEKSGDVLDGSMTQPVKFQERWTWARSVGTEEWKLEGIAEE